MKEYTVIDGGMSTELTDMGFVIDNDPLWSSRLLQTSPESIQKAHENYIESGSQVITTCSYQASIEGFTSNMGVSVKEAELLITSSVSLAQNAIPKGSEVKVAGSIGPYGAILADGSEYHGKYVDQLTIEELMNWHRPRMSLLVKAECDLLAIETIPAAKEGLALIKLLREFPHVKAWLSFTCKDRRNTAKGDQFGQTVKICLQELSNSGQLEAIGVNCCSPDFVSDLASEAKNSIAAMNDGIIGVIAYPNSGATWTSKIGWDSNSVLRPLHSYVPDWSQSGVTWWGGCCQTTHKDIQLLVNQLENFYVK